MKFKYLLKLQGTVEKFYYCDVEPEKENNAYTVFVYEVTGKPLGKIYFTTNYILVPNRAQ